jgi:RHS repeat-associated protein
MYLKVVSDGSAALTANCETTTDAYTLRRSSYGAQAYEAFGNPIGQAGTTVNPYKYVGTLGYYTDQTTKLYHVGARYYSPQVGRFWTQDPVRVGVNWYPYAADNPVNRADPSGLQAEWCYIAHLRCMEGAALREGACHTDCATGVGFVGALASVLACAAAVATKNPVLIVVACGGIPAVSLACFIRCWNRCDRRYAADALNCQVALDLCLLRQGG